MTELSRALMARRTVPQRGGLAARLFGQRDPLATGDPVTDLMHNLPREPARYGAELTTPTPGNTVGERPVFALPQEGPLVTPERNRLSMRLAEAATGFSSGTAMRGGVRAYHGSPHSFDRFSMDRIGTGEGAQAYGHGLYFADNEGVARSYRDALAPGRQIHIDGAPATRMDWGAATGIAQHGGNVDDYINTLNARIERYSRQGIGDPRLKAMAAREIAEVRQQIEAANALRGRQVREVPNGSMYEVNLNVDPARLLDWDAPLSAQPNAPLQQLLEQTPQGVFRPEEMRGSGAYWTLAERMRPRGAPDAAGAVAANAALREAGIPGLRYLDGGSRAAGEGSRNYVMFDDSLIEILRKYGIAGGGFGLGAANAPFAGPTEQ